MGSWFEDERYRREVLNRLQRVAGVDTDPALAEKIGVSQQAVSKWLKGTKGTRPTPPELGHRQIIHYLWRRWEAGDHVSMDWVYYGVGTPALQGEATSDYMVALQNMVENVSKLSPQKRDTLQTLIWQLTR